MHMFWPDRYCISSISGPWGVC